MVSEHITQEGKGLAQLVLNLPLVLSRLGQVCLYMLAA